MIGVGFIVSTYVTAMDSPGDITNLRVFSWIGYGSLHAPATNSVQWRFPLALQALPALLLCIGMFWLPESPRHLVEKQKDEEAMKVLRRLHHDGTNDEWILTEFTEIKATIDAERELTAPGWLVMFRVPQWRKRLLYVCLQIPSVC